MIVQSDKNVVVEEAVAEGLPPGWMKEVRVTQRGKSIRRDSYYTDPISGYVFLSLKDCKRYLKTGVLGKSSYKPKNKDHVDMELESDNISSPAIDQGKEVQDGGIDKPGTENKEEILTPTITEDHICLQYPNSDQSRSDVTESDLNSQSTQSLEQVEGKSDSNINTLVSSPVVEDYPKNLLENGAEIHDTDKFENSKNKSNSKRSSSFPRRASKRLAGIELDPVPIELVENGAVHETDRIQTRINKSNDKSSSDFPRRSSKRLAGVELDPVLELKTNDRTRRPAAQLSGEATTSFSGKTHDLPTTEELPGKFVLGTMTSEHQRLSLGLPPANLANYEEPGVQEKQLQFSEEQAGEKEPSPILKEQAAEEKPLNASGEQYEAEDLIMLSKENQGKKEKLLFVSKEETAEKEHANVIDSLLESSTNFSMADIWQDPCIEFAIKTLTGVIPIGEENQADKQADKNSGSSAEMSFSDIWSDPCIEFAVKTLTGDLPLDEDLSMQNLLQQQVSSSDTQGVSSTMPPNINSFCPTDYISQRCSAAEKPQNREQQVTAASRIPQSSSRSLQTSGSTVLHQSIQDRTSSQHP
ncbi:methyl-CpG-binding domain-containing protein 13 isoform X2 [Daucus carota subsp. sativus]|nr:PREDICTED: methyl-CpG-binding domain-containing protein 13-like isoform X2 [Daucus carota subsp. sativus]